MTNEDVTITDPARIRDLVNNAMSYLPHLNNVYRAMATDLEIPLVDARDMQLAEMDTPPAVGEGVTGYRFYRINDHERLGGIYNQHIADGVETSEQGLHFWFDKNFAKAYMLAQLKNDIINKLTGDYDYLLERVTGIYKGVSADEGFLMSDISPLRTEIMRVTKNDIELLRQAQ